MRLAIAAATSCGLMVAGFVALVSFGGPCAIDPPPGSFYRVHITNDTVSTVVLLDGDNSRCTSRSGGPKRLVAGQATSCDYEMCAGGDIAVTSGELPLGCLALPTGDPDNRRLFVSQANPCESGAT